MWTPNRFALAIALLAFAATAYADGLSGSITPQIGGGIGGMFDGGLNSSGSFKGVAPVACGTGVIDLSTGCSLPIMLGLVP